MKALEDESECAGQLLFSSMNVSCYERNVVFFQPIGILLLQLSLLFQLFSDMWK